MQTILQPSAKSLKILGKPKSSDDKMRWMKYVLQKPVEDGVLLFHTLTRELILLTNEEYKYPDRFSQLQTRWFRVPNSTIDRQYADAVRMVIESLHQKPKYITSYTIFSTTDCNARCFYCYELGRSRVPMSEETAHKAAKYIINHCGGKTVKLNWFGGEPLYNKKVIDIICSDLKDKDIKYVSSMTTNGYLFDEETVNQAVNLWNLKGMQITLDGTEEVYNKCKAYIYKDGKSPYHIVMDNIERILNTGMGVNIRLNVDNHNAEDLLKLVDEIHNRFKEQKKLKIYSHVLFEFSAPNANIRSTEEREKIYAKQKLIQDKIKKYGHHSVRGLRRELPVNQCMADNDSALTILPDGSLGKCEHYSENNFVGHIDREELDNEAINEFKKRHAPTEACEVCSFYPECIRIKKCEEARECFPEFKQIQESGLLKSMERTYRSWKEKDTISEDKEEMKFDLC